MKFALVGIGKWGQTIIKTLKRLPTSSLVATCSRSPSTLPPELQVAPHFLDFDKMLNEVRCDTVIIATHPNNHYLLSNKALWRGKHVICEKPCMFTQEEFDSITNLARSNIFFTDYTNLYHDVIEKMQDLIQEGPSRLGLVLTNNGVGPVRTDYSDLWDYGSHVGSIIFHLFPNEDWYAIKFGKNAVGNHTLIMTSRKVDVFANFGNKSKERIHSFELTSYNAGYSVYWVNDRSENPLLAMFKKFEKGAVQTNINLSLRIQRLLRNGE